MAFRSFLHDAQMLEVLLERMQPALFGQPLFRVWAAGCPTGSEPYTLGMLLAEQMPPDAFDAVRIYATDADPTAGERIDSGVYAEQDVKQLPYPIRYRYFQVTDRADRMQVIDDLRDRVAFMRHDLLTLQPIRKDFSLIVCKEPLQRLNDRERHQTLRMFHRALRPGGLLAAEQNRNMPDDMDTLFEPISNSTQLYRRLDASETIGPHVDRAAFAGRSKTRSLHGNIRNIHATRGE
jgi:chemotaxis protein methyltransferase CheR